MTVKLRAKRLKDGRISLYPWIEVHLGPITFNNRPIGPIVLRSVNGYQISEVIQSINDSLPSERKTETQWAYSIYLIPILWVGLAVASIERKVFTKVFCEVMLIIIYAFILSKLPSDKSLASGLIISFIACLYIAL